MEEVTGSKPVSSTSRCHYTRNDRITVTNV
jgi:hypothetical protein